MILIYLLLSLVVGGFLVWLAGRWSKIWPRWISLIILGINLYVFLWLWLKNFNQPGLNEGARWMVELNLNWIPQLGISFHLGMDGLSLLLILLTNILAIMAVAASWSEIQYQVGFFHFNLILIVIALEGVFLSLDLFLFYFFWELMLVPLYFLIGIWGHENRIYAALKFFIFTQFSSLLMLIAILGLYVIHGQSTGIYTFEYTELLGANLPPVAAFWLMMGFFIAFAVKMPLFPLHTWLADAHTEAPTAGSVDLAGLVLKVAGYGFIRLLLPIFPAEAARIAPFAMALGVIGILYGAVLAFAQTDLKRLVAYTSISHMGFVMVGIFSQNEIALVGAVVIMLAHGITTSALFILVGELYERTGTRDLNRMGGLWETVPRMGRVGLIFGLASLGLPGLGNFVGEFLVLLGTYKEHEVFTVLATLGFILATVYSLWMIQRIFTGPNEEGWHFPDFNLRELAVLAVMVLIIFWLGLYPQPVLDTLHRPLSEIHSYSQQVILPNDLHWGPLAVGLDSSKLLPLEGDWYP